MTTAAYNASNPFAVAVGVASGRRAGKVSYVLNHQPKSFDWRARYAKPRPLKRLADAPFAQACECPCQRGAQGGRSIFGRPSGRRGSLDQLSVHHKETSS